MEYSILRVFMGPESLLVKLIPSAGALQAPGRDPIKIAQLPLGYVDKDYASPPTSLTIADLAESE